VLARVFLPLGGEDGFVADPVELALRPERVPASGFICTGARRAGAIPMLAGTIEREEDATGLLIATPRCAAAPA
jgi:hypothetical protein